MITINVRKSTIHRKHRMKLGRETVAIICECGEGVVRRMCQVIGIAEMCRKTKHARSKTYALYLELLGNGEQHKEPSGSTSYRLRHHGKEFKVCIEQSY